MIRIFVRFGEIEEEIQIVIKKMFLGKISIIALAFTVLAVVVGFNFYGDVSAQSNEVKAVTDVLTQEAQAVEKGDLAALDKLWANSEDVTVFESGHANYGWNDYRNNHLAPELKEFKNTKYAFSALKVKVDGKWVKAGLNDSERTIELAKGIGGKRLTYRQADTKAH